MSDRPDAGVRVLVCGPRDMTDYWLVHEVLNGIHKATPITCVIEGGALGADRYAQRWRIDREIPGLTFAVAPIDWEKYGKAAGPRRNAQMIREGKPDRVVAFISTPSSKGTANMVQQAKKAGLPVFEVVLDAH